MFQEQMLMFRYPDTKPSHILSNKKYDKRFQPDSEAESRLFAPFFILVLSRFRVSSCRKRACPTCAITAAISNVPTVSMLATMMGIPE